MAVQSNPCILYVDNRPTSLSLILNADSSVTPFNHQPNDLLDGV